MLEIRVLEPSDQAALEAWLLPRVASSMILLANSRKVGLRERSEAYHGTYAGAFEDGALIGVAAHYWVGNVILQAPDHAAALCRHAIRASGRPLEGLLGPDAQVAAVLEALAITPAQLRLDSAEGLFQLSLAALRVPPQLASGEVCARRARHEDLPVLAPWRAAYNVEAVNEPDTPAQLEDSRRELQRKIAEQTVWLAEHDGRPVAMTGFNAVTAEAVQVGGVYTPPALRGRGYARAAVAQSLIDAHRAGAQTSTLFTGDDNPSAQRVYLALGYERIGDYRLSFFTAPLPADG
jgi:RimJ/RimL family protein N-acetyltransferase